MDVFEAYDKHVRPSMTPEETKEDDSKLFELPDEGTENHTEETNEQNTTPAEFKMSEDDMNAIVSKVVEALKGGDD